MHKEQLIELRNKILQSTQEIALRGEGSEAERLQILLSIVRSGNASIEVLTRAYELVQSSENDDDKLSVLLDVLYEVDAKIAAEDDAAGTPDNTAPQEQQAQQQNDQ